MNYLIIVAGGNGERMKSKENKIFLKIKNKPIIYWTFKAFEESSVIDSIIVCARTDDLKKLKNIINKYHFKKVIKLIPAEKSRQETTMSTLLWLKTKAKKDDLIGIHNAVNPFVSRREIEDVFTAARKHRAALLAYPARDTVKVTNGNNLVDNTPIRNSCWYAQTPQVAFYRDLFKAFVKARDENFVGTDDTQLLEKVEIKAKIISCSRYNFKITFPEDLILARRIMSVFMKENKL